MPIKEEKTIDYEKKAGFEDKGLQEKSLAILGILYATEDLTDFYFVKEIAEALKAQGITEKNVYVNRTLWSLVKRKKGALVRVRTYEGKTLFAITEEGVKKLSDK